MANPKNMTVFHAIYKMMKSFSAIMDKLTNFEPQEHISDEIMQEIKEMIQKGITEITSEKDIPITEVIEMLHELSTIKNRILDDKNRMLDELSTKNRK